jgi:hypothetical protein
MTNKPRRSNGIVLLAGGGRKVEPTEILLEKKTYRLLLESFEYPVDSIKSERDVAAIAADLHVKYRYRKDNDYGNKNRIRPLKKSRETDFIGLSADLSPFEERESFKLLSAGGF